ncbi:MAG: TetR/AcrR family transcriptional regulator [Leptospiraceae bacterium]|nr:TetR/AcrR family transcriptional regulator [Leptospiraceae bacterium]
MNEVTKKKIRRGRNSLSQKEILDVSRAILADEGISGLSMRKIANRLGCSVASPYAHFESIEEIVKGLVLRGEETLTGMIKNAHNEDSSCFDQVAATARAYWTFAQENKELHKLMFHVGDGVSHRKFLTVIPVSYRNFLLTIKKGIETGEFKFQRKDYPGLARTMWAWIYGLLVLDLTGVLSIRKSDSDPLEEGIRFFKVLLENGWGAK